MKQTNKILLTLLFFAVNTGLAYGELPDLPRQELWVKLVSLVVGLGIIFVLCIIIINRLIYNIVDRQGDLSSKISIILGVIFSYLWFLYLFGQIFSSMISIALGVLITIIGTVYILHSGDSDRPGRDGDSNDNDYSY